MSMLRSRACTCAGESVSAVPKYTSSCFMLSAAHPACYDLPEGISDSVWKLKHSPCHMKTERLELIIRFPVLFGDTPANSCGARGRLSSNQAAVVYRCAADERGVLEAEVKYMLGDRSAALSSSINHASCLVNGLHLYRGFSSPPTTESALHYRLPSTHSHSVACVVSLSGWYQTRPSEETNHSHAFVH